MFLDNGPTFDPSQSTLTDAQFRQYYIPLYTMLEGPQLSWQVQLNASQYPGQDANGGPSDWILSAPAADSVVVFEQSTNVYFNEYGAIYPGGFVQPAPAWWSTAAPNYKTAHVLSNATQYDVQKVADLTSSRSATLVYIFDGNSGAYDHVSCYFEQEVAYLQNHQSTGGAGKTWCASSAACSDLRSDTNNCGACDNVCDPGWSCQASKCVPPACPSGYRACPDATCVRLPGHCF